MRTPLTGPFRAPPRLSPQDALWIGAAIGFLLWAVQKW